VSTIANQRLLARSTAGPGDGGSSNRNSQKLK